MSRAVWAIGLLIAAVLPSVGVAERKLNTGSFHRCPASGKGGDTTLNEQKNRDVAPASYATSSISELVADAPAARAAGKADRDTWTSEQRASIAKQEAKAVRVIGYLAGVAKEEGEACNCGSKEFVDYHMWLVEKPKQKRYRSMVIELSPRLLAAHPTWPERARRAWRNGAHLRISGWRTWDQEHPEQLHDTAKRHATRKTLWEIHPVHMIEIEVGDRWKKIEDIDVTAIE